MNVDLDTSIRRMRFIRNIPVIDQKTGTKKRTRQVRSPLVGSEVCPFINYVNKYPQPKANLKYSIMIIEKEITLEFVQVACVKHETCILFKDIAGIIKHLEECEFWYDPLYWEKKYPQEIEIL